MKAIAFAALLALAGCGTMQTVAPNTAAGFEEGGVLGALTGASGALLVTCRTLDGQAMRVAVDDLATVTDAASEIADVRTARQRACAAAGAVYIISGGLDAALPEMAVHRAAADAPPEAAEAAPAPAPAVPPAG